MQQFLVFAVDDDELLAFRLEAVGRVVQAVLITSVPEPPALVLGLINVEGMIVPVLDLRRLLARPPRDLDINDQMILMHGAERPYAVVADGVLGVWECPDADVTPASAIVPGLTYMDGVLTSRDGTALICNFDSCEALRHDWAEEAPNGSAAVGLGNTPLPPPDQRQ